MDDELPLNRVNVKPFTWLLIGLMAVALNASIPHRIEKAPPRGAASGFADQARRQYRPDVSPAA